MLVGGEGRGGEGLLKLKASLASAEVSAGAVAKADQYCEIWIYIIINISRDVG